MRNVILRVLGFVIAIGGLLLGGCTGDLGGPGRYVDNTGGILASVGLGSGARRPVSRGSRQAFTYLTFGQTRIATCPATSGAFESGCILPPPEAEVVPEFGLILPPEADARLVCSEVTLDAGQSATLTTQVIPIVETYSVGFLRTPLLFSYVTGSPVTTTGIDRQAITVTAQAVPAATRVVVTAELGWVVLGGPPRRIHCDHVVNIRPSAPPPSDPTVPAEPAHGTLACTAGATRLLPGASTTLSAGGTSLIDGIGYSYEAAALANVGTLVSAGAGMQLVTRATVDWRLSEADRTVVLVATSRDAYGVLRATCPAIVVEATPRPPTQVACHAAPLLGPTDTSFAFLVTASSDATAVRLTGLVESPMATAPAVPGSATLEPGADGTWVVRYTAVKSKNDTAFRIHLEAEGNTLATTDCVGTKQGNPYGPENGWKEPPSYASCFAPQPWMVLPNGTGFALVTFSGGTSAMRSSVTAVGPHDVELLRASGGYLVRLSDPSAWRHGEQVHVTAAFGSATSSCHFNVTAEGGMLPPQLPLASCGRDRLLLQTQQAALLQYETPGQPAAPAPRVTVRARYSDDGSAYTGTLGIVETLAVGDVTTLRYTSMSKLTRDVILDIGVSGSGDAVCTVRVASSLTFGIPDDGSTQGLVGNVWLLPKDTNPLPAEPPGEPVMTIVSPTINYYARDWTGGIQGAELPVASVDRPGEHCRVSGDKCHLIEWFMIRYRGVMLIPQTGRHCFRVQSDDGVRVTVDGRLAHAYAPIHPPTWTSWCMDLSAGAHPVLVDYMQGPRVYIALSLEVQFPGASSYVVAPATMWARGLGL